MFFKGMEKGKEGVKQAGAPMRKGAPGMGSRSCPYGAEQNGSATRQADPYGGVEAAGFDHSDNAGYFGLDSQ